MIWLIIINPVRGIGKILCSLYWSFFSPCFLFLLKPTYHTIARLLPLLITLQRLLIVCKIKSLTQSTRSHIMWPAATSHPSFHITLLHLSLFYYPLNQAHSCLRDFTLNIASAWDVYPSNHTWPDSILPPNLVRGGKWHLF